jgi:hypothetical protein
MMMTLSIRLVPSSFKEANMTWSTTKTSLQTFNAAQLDSLSRLGAPLSESSSTKLSSKSESKVIKFNAKDWLKWHKSSDDYFRWMIGIQGVTLDWA